MTETFAIFTFRLKNSRIKKWQIQKNPAKINFYLFKKIVFYIAKTLNDKPSTASDKSKYEKNDQNDDYDDEEEDYDEPPLPSLTNNKPISTSQPTIFSVKPPDSIFQVKGFPTGCHDLKRLGHTLDGFYLIRSDTVVNKIDTVYCDFGNFSGAQPTTGGPLEGVTAVSTEGLIYSFS